MHPSPPKKTTAVDKEDWYAKKTEIVTQIALFLSYLLGIPAILGAIGSAIVVFITAEPFLGGEYTIGIFILFFSLTCYFFVFVFLKGIRRKLWHVIEPPHILKDLGFMLMVLFFPMLLISGIFWIIGEIQDYNSYQFGFQFPIVIGFQLIGLGLLRFWNLPEPILPMSELPPSQPPQPKLIKLEEQLSQTSLAEKMANASESLKNIDLNAQSKQSELPEQPNGDEIIETADPTKTSKKSTKKSTKKSSKKSSKRTSSTLEANISSETDNRIKLTENLGKISEIPFPKDEETKKSIYSPEIPMATNPEPTPLETKVIWVSPKEIPVYSNQKIQEKPLVEDFVNKEPSKPGQNNPLTGESLLRVFMVFILLKIVCETIGLAISESIGTWILINGLSWLGLCAIIVIFPKWQAIPKSALPEITILWLRSLFIIPTFLYMIVALFSSAINLFLYVLIISTLLYKIIFTSTVIAAKPVCETHKIVVPWNRVIRANEIITVALYLTLFTVFLALAPEAWIAMVIALVFLIDLAIERRIQLITFRFSAIFFPANLIVIAALFAFAVLPIPVIAGLIIFTFLLTFVSNIVMKEGLISQRIHVFIQNAIYTALFFEIGIYFAILTADNLLFISDSVVFNYFFFITMASLSSLYRLWWVQFDRQPNRILNRLIIGHLYFIFFGIALIFQDIMVAGWELAVPIIQSSTYTFYLLRPSILLAPISKGIAGIYTWIGSLNSLLPFFFKSAEGYASILTMMSAATIGVLLLALAVNLHRELKIVSTRTILMHKFVHRLCAMCLIIAWPIILLQSLTGLFIAITLGTLASVLVLETANELKLVPETQYLIWTSRILLINLSESLFLWVFLSLEVFLVDLSTALIIAISALLLYQNFIPRVQQKIKSSTLHLINAFLIITLAALVIPSSIFLLEKYSVYQAIDYLLITTLMAILVLSVALKVAIRELHKANLIIELRWKILNFGVSLLIIALIYAIIVYWSYMGLISTDTTAIGVNFIAAIMFIIFAPILGFAAIGLFFKNRLQEADPQQSKWCGYVAFIGWCLPSLILPLALMIQTSFSFFFIILGLLIMGICAIVPMNDVKDALPLQGVRIDQVREIILEVILALILVDVFVLCTEFIAMPWPWALICALTLLLVFIYTVPIYKQHLNIKARILITVVVIFGDSWLIAGMLFALPLLSLTAILAILLIPTTIAFVCIQLLSRGVIMQPRVFQANQILAGFFFGLITTIIFTAALPFFSFLWTLSLSLFVLTGMLIYDLGFHRLLTGDRHVLSLFFGLFLIDLTLGSLLIIESLPIPLEYQIMGFFMLMIPGVNILANQFTNWRQKLIRNHSITPQQEPVPSLMPVTPTGTIQEQPYLDARPAYAAPNDQYRFFYRLEQKIPQIQLASMIGLFIILITHILIVAIKFPPMWGVCALFLITILMAALSSITMEKYDLKSMYGQSLLAFFFLIIIRSDLTEYLLSMENGLALTTIAIGQVFIMILYNRLFTKNDPSFPLMRNIMIASFIGLYYLLLAPTGISVFSNLIIGSLCYNLVSYPRFKNLISRSLLTWATVFGLANLLFEVPDLSIIIIIGLPLAIGFTWQWILCQLDTAWHQTYVKKTIGYGAIYAWIFTYITLMVLYPTIFQTITPFVLIVLVIVLNKLKPKLPHREQLFNIITLLSVVAITYTFSASYFFFDMNYRTILAVSLSLAVFGFTFLFLFRKLEMQLSKEIIGANLLAGTVFAGIFSYFFLIDPVFINCPWQIAFSISADLTVVAFFLAIGIYQHDFTKRIWSIGWPIWNLIPIVNFFMFSYLISGIDYFTHAWTVINADIQGSYLLTILICSLMYLPVLTYKLKHQMYRIIYIFWFELIAIAAWTAVNIFPTNPSIQGVFVAFVALLILVPIFSHYGLSQFLTLIWFPLGAMNIVFLTLLLQLPAQWQVPIDLLLAGFYVLSCGYFRYIRHHLPKGQYVFVVMGYLLIYGSVFTLLYSFMQILFIDPMIAFNFTAIFMAFGLLSSKYIDFDEKIVKIVLSCVSIINIGMLVGRTFSLIPDFLLMGIFLGIGFSAGSTLAFQARKFLPTFFREIIWLIMAVCFGLSIAELVLSILGIGWWAAIGSFIIISALIAYPLYQKHAVIAPTCILGLAMWIMEAMLLISGINTVNPALLFLIIALGFELLYIYGTRQTSWVFGRDEKQALEIFVAIWVIYAFLIAALTIQLILMGLNLDWLTIILLFTLIGAFLNVVSGKLTIKYDLFDKYPKTHQFVEISRNGIILIAYINSALLLALNLPLFGDVALIPNALGFEIAYRFAIFFGVMFLETFGVDQYFFGLIRSSIRYQLKMISYAACSFCGFLMIGLGTGNWALAVLILAVLSFGTIRLNINAGNRIYPEITKFVNVLVILITLFIVLWPVFDTTNTLSTLYIGPLTLNIFICFSILYLFMRTKIIDHRIEMPIFITSTVFLTITCAEYLRQFVSINPLLYSGICVLVLVLTNLYTIRRTPLMIYGFWTALAYAFGSFISEMVYFLGDYAINTGDAVLIFFFTFGIINTFFYLALAKRFFMIDPLEEPKELLLVGYPIIKDAKKVFALWSFIEAVIISIAFTRVWVYVSGSIVTEFQIDILRQVLVWLTLIPLILFAQLSAIFAYIRRYELWQENTRLIPIIMNARNIIALSTYGLLPLFVTINAHYGMVIAIPIEYTILVDILIFASVFFLGVALLDMKKLHLIEVSLASKMSIGSVLTIGASLGILFFLGTGAIFGSFIIFSLTCYILKFFLSPEILSRVFFVVNLSLYIEILGQLTWIFFEYIPWLWALFLTTLIFHLMMELEVRMAFLPPFKPWVKIVRQYSWLALIFSSALCVLLFQLPTFSVWHVFTALLVICAQLLYYNKLLNAERTSQYQQWYSILGQAIYIDILAVLAALLIPFSLQIVGAELGFILLAQFGIYCGLCFLAFTMLKIDAQFLKFIPENRLRQLNLLIYVLGMGFISIEIWLFAYNMMEIIQSGEPVNILVAFLCTTIFLSLFSHRRFHNRIADQLFYTLISLEVLGLFYAYDYVSIMVIAAFIALLLYPFIFFMELIQKLFWAMVNGIKNLITNFVRFIRQLIINIRNWFSHNQKTIVLVLSIIISIGMLIWLLNPFLSMLIGLVMMYNYSPEREHDTNAQNFKKKVLYRGTLYVSLIGTALWYLLGYLSSIYWLIPLALLVFFAYLIWVVRKSEELYQLPIQWRFWSATLTIIDAIVVIILFII